jgi:hypothetical protein
MGWFLPPWVGGFCLYGGRFAKTGVLSRNLVVGSVQSASSSSHRSGIAELAPPPGIVRLHRLPAFRRPSGSQPPGEHPSAARWGALVGPLTPRTESSGGACMAEPGAAEPAPLGSIGWLHWLGALAGRALRACGSQVAQAPAAVGLRGPRPRRSGRAAEARGARSASGASGGQRRGPASLCGSATLRLAPGRATRQTALRPGVASSPTGLTPHATPCALSAWVIYEQPPK